MIEWSYPSDDSLPSSELLAEMTRFEEAIDALTDDNGFSVSMMVRTEFGKREWLFYTSDYERFMGTFNQLLAGHEQYPVQITHGDDPEWGIWQEMVDSLNAQQDNEQLIPNESGSAGTHTDSHANSEHPSSYDLAWFDQYSGQSTDELLALEGQYRIDSLVCAFEAALQQKAERVGDDQLSEEEHVILAVEALEREVNNGGYSQFFVNPSNIYAPTIVHALNAIGCTTVANLTEEALHALDITGAITVEAIDQSIAEDNEERYEQLEACTTRYYEIAGDLAMPLWEYIKRNRNAVNLKD